MPRVKDRTGERFGRLVCVSYVDSKNPEMLARWLCRCDCGTEKVIIYKRLTSGRTASCGCLRREVTSRNSTTHGHSRPGRMTGEYRSWMSMKQRCTNVNHSDYKDYGAVGIFVCQRWLDSFQNFLDDMGLKPSRLHSLDRWPNQAGGYEPGNCRWATPKEQANNVKDNRLITCCGRSQTLAEWADETGIRYATILARIDRHKWPVEEALGFASHPSRATGWRSMARFKRLTDEEKRIRVKARLAVSRAVHRGDISRARDLPCHDCNQPADQYHHWAGYEQHNWLNVIPVCLKCHEKQSPQIQPRKR